MKAVILAGGEGTRLRPLTLDTPKPVAPVADRPLLQHQLDLLGRAGITDVVFSLAFRPHRIQEVFGDGRAYGKTIHYVVEDSPLGTGGAVKNAESLLDDTTVVFNGDILTDVDLGAVIDGHRRSGSRATLVLTPVPNPSAYGLVETDADGRVLRFLEKPDPSQITTDTINAGIYILDTATLSLIPPGRKHSIERSFFPELLATGDRVSAHVHRGYWIDIGTPEKYLQVHRDILARRFPVELRGKPQAAGWVHPEAVVHLGARLEGAFYVGPGCRIDAGARVGPDAVLMADTHVEAGAAIEDSVLWRGCRMGAGSRITGALLGRGVRVGANAVVGPGALLGEESTVSDYSRTGPSA